MLTILDNVKIESIACCIPKRSFSIFEYLDGLLSEKEARRVAKGTGFKNLRITEETVTTADLCYSAALKCLNEKKDDIDALIFVTQTPDYYLPATSHILQERLNLNNNIFCLDINEGCAGYVYGIYVASLLISTKQCKKVLLVAGDTISKLTDKNDKSARCIFGDGGTATILSWSVTNKIAFNFETFGEKSDAIIVPNSRHRISKQKPYLFLDSIEIMNFILTDVPNNISSLLSYLDTGVDEISIFACHQANEMILKALAKKINIPSEKMPFLAENIGNASSASIPLLLNKLNSEQLNKTLVCGFGVGFTVGSCIADLSETKMVGVFEYE